MRQIFTAHRSHRWYQLLFISLLGIPTHKSIAAFPSQFTYQGSLKQNGAPVNGTYPLEFSLTNSDGSQIYWTSGVQNISIQEGLYRVDLSPTGVEWSGVEPYLQLTVNGNILLPREKLTASPYALTARELTDGAVAQGDLIVTGKMGIGSEEPDVPLTIVDQNPATDVDEIIYTANGEIWNEPVQLKLGFKDYFPSIQSYRVNVGPNKLSLNPYGGEVGIGLTNPRAALTIYKHGLQGEGVTNTLIAAGYNVEYLEGGAHFEVQQWFNATEAKTYILGNGYVSGGAYAVPNDSPWAKFQAIEFTPSRFGFVWNNAGSIFPAVDVNPANGYIGIGTSAQSEKLEVAGNVKLSGQLKSEQNKPAFFVNVYADDCGWSHPYLGCPSGYSDGGRWHTGPGIQCDGATEGVGYENGSIDRGWMVLCVAQ